MEAETHRYTFDNMQAEARSDTLINLNAKDEDPNIL